MKIHILGVTRRHGKGKESGNDYDMAFANITVPLRPNVSPDNVFQAAGFRQTECELDPNCINDFLSLSYPATYEVITDNRPSQNGLVAVITGIKKA